MSFRWYSDGYVNVDVDSGGIVMFMLMLIVIVIE